MVEQWTENPCVGGSNPPLDNQLNNLKFLTNLFMKLIKLKPNTSGTRHQLNIQKSLLSKTNNVLKSSIKGKKENAGKSTVTGRTTVWHKGRGCKSKYRKIIFLKKDSTSFVVCTMFDPSRSACISLNFDIESQ